ncbi:hypothetical protein SDC9_135259 [bioreactor metagenome]|uniref:Uncharacterized protein n=1 Tax=bioreactor metagenome TaxID=1076179 RepID=A0A645DGJ1_9ZZZZ
MMCRPLVVTSAEHECVVPRGLGGDPDALGLQVFLDCLHATLAPEAAALVAAKRRGEAGGAVVVDPYRSGLKVVAHVERAMQVARPHSGSQTEQRVIGDAKRVAFVVERHHCQHRAEHLFARDAHVVAHAGEDGGRNELPLPVFGPAECMAAQHAGGTLGLGDVDVVEDLAELPRRGDGADLGVHVGRVADLG